jgi:hypothetical protein
MHSLRKSSRWIMATIVLASLGAAATASAFAPRSPQVAFVPTVLQAYLNYKGESINVTTDQLDGQVWSTSVSGNASFTLMIEMTATPNANSIGVYNATGVSPTLFQIFPGSASAGWHAMAHFGSGSLVVTLFDVNGFFMGQTTYSGVNETQFGFYLQGPNGTFYSEDFRNGGNPQVLTFAGTGRNAGDWWQCFDDSGYLPAVSDFDDAVLMLQSVVPIGTETQTWGSVKDLYR